MSSIPNSYIDDIRRIVQSILNQLEHLKVRWLTGVEKINDAEWSDVNYGVTVCTSTTRPTGYVGRTINETDTGDMLVYNGVSWVVKVGANYGQTAQVHNPLNKLIVDNVPTIYDMWYEVWDTDNIFSGPMSSRLTCRTAGIYQISASGRFESGAAGERRMRILKTDSSFTLPIADITRTLVTAIGTDLHLHRTIQMEVDDYVEVEVTQKSGSGLYFVYVAESSPNFTMQRMPG